MKQPAETHAMHAHSDQHAEHDKHAGHSIAMFRRKFWIVLLLTIPTLLWGHMLQRALRYTAILSLQELKDKAERLRRKWARDPDNFCFWETGLCLSSCDCPDSERLKRERHEETGGGFSGAVRTASRQGSHNGRRSLLPSVWSGM